MKSKKVGIVGGIVAAAMLVTGLTMPAAQAATVVTIWTDLDRASAFQSWAKAFNRKHKSIVVNVIGKDGHKDKLKTVSDTDAPDIIVGAHDWIGPLQSDGSILPLTIANASQFDKRDKDAFKLGGATYDHRLPIERKAEA